MEELLLQLGETFSLFLGFSVVTYLRFLIGKSIKPVKGKHHDEICTSCSREIVGMRFSRPSNFEPDSPLLEANGPTNLCQECYINRKEGGEVSKHGNVLDPYWLIIPCLWQFGDSDVFCL